MKIELATIQDVPALLDLQRKAFGPLCEELNWKDAPPLTESLEHAYEEFARCTTLKVQNDEGLIIGSVHGNVTDGSLYIGRLMVLLEYQQQSIGKLLFREIQTRLPHRREGRTWTDVGLFGEMKMRIEAVAFKEAKDIIPVGTTSTE